MIEAVVFHVNVAAAPGTKLLVEFASLKRPIFPLVPAAINGAVQVLLLYTVFRVET